MRRSLLIMVLSGLLVFCAGNAVVMAKDSPLKPVTTILDVPVTSYFVTIPSTSGEGVYDTVPLSGQIQIVATLLPPNPIQPSDLYRIRASAILSLSDIGDATFRYYMATQSSNSLQPQDPFIPQDPYRTAFNSLLLQLFPPNPFIPGTIPEVTAP